jgi:hypothetical protein
MFSTLVEGRRKGRRLIAPTLGAVLAGIGMAVAQPGSDFQDRGNREDIGTHVLPRANSYVMQSPAIIGPRERAFASTPDRTTARSMRDRTRRHR